MGFTLQQRMVSVETAEQCCASSGAKQGPRVALTPRPSGSHQRRATGEVPWTRSCWSLPETPTPGWQTAWECRLGFYGMTEQGNLLLSRRTHHHPQSPAFERLRGLRGSSEHCSLKGFYNPHWVRFSSDFGFSSSP